MSDTPRTDKMIDSCGDYEKPHAYIKRLHEFAKGLERELTITRPEELSAEGTPRTDAAELPLSSFDEASVAADTKVVYAAVARQLERELAKMTEKYAYALEKGVGIHNELTVLQSPQASASAEEAVGLLREALPFTIVNHPTAIELERRIVAFLKSVKP